ncbi:hypothetical protein BASA81_001441 [Batrachochytrium salamandrivorans]|nr:hypothetical protein BASA81_001441 [Batrachochytrium salamandrivorans]
MSIRQLQLDALERALKSSAEASSPWKVLVYDQFGRDLVSTLALGKKTLWRDHNVTLKMLIDSPRERVGDVTAVYFCLPLDDNLDQIARDVAQGLYDSIHLHFLSPIARHQLEKLAKEVAKSNNALSVAKVWDQNLGFVALERSLFSLHLPGSFAGLNSSLAKDEDVVSSLNRFAEGLTNVLTAVEPRPLLLILDRGSDLCTPLQHSDGYQALVDDLLGPLFLNRLLGKDGKTPDFVLDAEIDDFWRQYAGVPIPDAVTEQMNAVKEVEDKSRRLGGGGGGSAFPSNEDATSASVLLEAVSALPELTARKKSLETHGNVLRQVFEVVKRRGIHEFPELEARMARGRNAAKAEKSNVLKLVGDPSKELQDKLRLAMVYAFAAKISVSELDELEKVLWGGGGEGENGDAATKLAEAKQNLAYLRRVLTMLQRSKPSSAAAAAASSGGGAAASVLFSAADFAFGQFQEKLQTVASSVTGSTSWGPAARAVDAVCGGGGSGMGATGMAAIDQEIDTQYLYFDPKQGTLPLPPNATRFKGPFPKCIVFVVGGGCYTEHRNLAQYAAQRKREVLYGSTEILSPSQFLQQMRE